MVSDVGGVGAAPAAAAVVPLRAAGPPPIDIGRQRERPMASPVVEQLTVVGTLTQGCCCSSKECCCCCAAAARPRRRSRSKSSMGEDEDGFEDSCGGEGSGREKRGGGRGARGEAVAGEEERWLRLESTLSLLKAAAAWLAMAAAFMAAREENAAGKRCEKTD